MSTVGVNTYQVGDLTVTDNYMPIELVWEGLLTDVEMGFVKDSMPVLRKNQKDAEFAFATHAAEVDHLDMIEKSHQRWQESLLIRTR